MAGDYTIWHNPRCSTSRFVLEALRRGGIEPVVRDYQKDPPSADELRAVLAAMDGTPRDLLRRKGDLYLEMGLDDPGLTDEQLLNVLSSHPQLIERPLVIAPMGTVLCRPKDRVFDLLPQSQTT
ncbi:arsenate reductase (glutaredoxin) [Paracoccus zhejiangensis]|uniref:Arsenate reductase n=1 Tax=Paracoccus zhejiangensis TaxID=1077935 RepID=A0A2H5EYD9_9RHOB|nr:arsenate reductase (glutaredoxin) [Paracoccus zhejiangensis]AUH64310.1 arsenate reductase (glutaredoxin) [Paracoccus zhejiangensis]